MRTYTHHAIVVTAPTFREAYEAQAAAETIFPWVGPTVSGVTGGAYTFIVAPDGAREGTPLSEEGDERRARFRAYLARNPCLRWVEIVYDLDGARIVAADSTNPNGAACG
jgi:hypothetical protein